MEWDLFQNVDVAQVLEGLWGVAREILKRLGFIDEIPA